MEQTNVEITLCQSHSSWSAESFRWSIYRGTAFFCCIPDVRILIYNLHHSLRFSPSSYRKRGPHEGRPSQQARW